MHQEIKLMEENAAPLFRPLGLGKRKEEQRFRMHLAKVLLKVYPNPMSKFMVELNQSIEIAPTLKGVFNGLI